MENKNNNLPNNPETNVENLGPFKKFCMTIGTLPSSYLECLTYQELLLWFCDYLKNTVIPTVNNNAEAVEELQNLYIELKNYVDNYFKNLDVQEEINNKLDTMTQDGTLWNIIQPYFDSFTQETNEKIDAQNSKFDSFTQETNEKIDAQNSKFDSFTQQTNVKIDAQNSKIDTLNQRMNSFTSLPEGSTSSDAELNDIKIGLHQTFSTPGEAVRKQIENVMCYPFEDIGGASNYIKYIKVIGIEPSKRLVISNIQNKYEDDPSTSDYAFYVFPSDNNGNSEKDNGIRVNLPSISGYYQFSLPDYGENAILFVYYDLSSLEENSRYTDDGYQALIKQDCYNPYYLSDYFVENGGASNYIKYIKILGINPTNRFVISNIQNKYEGDTQTSDYAFYVFPSDNNGNSEKDKGIRVNLPSISGYYQFSLPNYGENAIFSIIYDLSSIKENSRYTDDGKQALISQNCYIPSINSNLNKADCTNFSLFEKFAVIGDSYASGQIFKHNGSNVTNYNLSWGQILARKHGNSCLNLSKGGLTTETWLTDNQGLQKMKDSDPQQLYILTLGINDVTRGTALGTINDITENYQNNPNTFYGNYGKIIEEILLKAPNSKIIMSTMANNSENYSSFNNAIIEIANHYNIPYIIQYNNDFFNSSYYLNNMVYGHPTSVIYAGMANAIDNLICKCLLDNIEYFENYVG